MKVQWRWGAGIALLAVQTVAVASTVDVPITCSGGIDAALTSAIAQMSPGVIDIHNSTLNVDRVHFYNASAASLAYIVATASPVTIKRSLFEHGNATAGGGAINASSGVGAFALSVSDTTFSQNLAHDGGAISADVPMTLDRSLFVANQASNFGGAVFVAGRYVAIRNSTFTANVSFESGAIYLNGGLQNYTVLLNNVTLYDDNASTGGTQENLGSELYFAGNSPFFATINNTLVGGTCAGMSSTLAAHGTIESPGNTCFFPASGNQLARIIHE